MIRRPLPAVAAVAAAVATVVLASPFAAPELAAQAAPPPPPPPAVAELSVEVRDAAGAPLADVAPGELVVRQAGEARAVLSLAPEGRPWRLLLYFDAALAGRTSLPRAAAALEAAAPRLVALGEVEVVVAGDDGVRQALPPTRDPDVLAAALARVAVFERGEERIVELRRPVARPAGAAGGEEGEAAGEGSEGGESGGTEGRERQSGEIPDEENGGPGGGLAGDGGPVTSDETAGDIAALEVALVHERLDLLLERLAAPWAGEADGPAAVFWVGDGYDLDPGAWRRPAGEEAPAAAPAPLAEATATAARAVAALGWTVVPVAPQVSAADDPSRWGAAPFELPSGDTTVLPTYRLPRRPTAAERAADAVAAAQPPEPVPVAPGQPLAAFAAASGGYLVSSAAEVSEVVDRLAARLRLRYAAPPDEGGEPAPLAVAIAGDGGPVASSATRAPPGADRPRETADPGVGGGTGTTASPPAAGVGEPPAAPPVAPPAAPGSPAPAAGGGDPAAVPPAVPPAAPGPASGAEAAGGESIAAGDVAPERSVVARRWSASALPPAVSALRARRVLDGALDPGTVEVRAAVAVAGGAPGEAALEVEVDPPLAGDPLRLTLAALGDDGRPRVEHRRLAAGTGRAPGAVPLPIPLPSAAAAAQEPVPEALPPAAGGSAESGVPVDAAPAPPAGGSAGPAGPVDSADPSAPPRATWTWRGTVALPPGAERVAVLVEDPASGAWGGTLAGVVDLSLDAASVWDAATGVLPGPGAVRLLRPEGAMLAGRVRFETVVSPAVARVELRLDGRRVAAAVAAPFAAVVDLGRLPLARRVEAVAFDAAGNELGRDETVVNGGSGRLAVRLVEPAAPGAGEPLRAIGPVTVAVDVAVPEGQRLERVELYWQERRVATLFRPPFRHRLVVRPEAAPGLLRAVARTAEGGEAEDAVYLNGPGPAERLDVSLTELYVVVTGGDGRPVRGLGKDDFTVREEGRRQPIATFGDAADLPLTLGLALDTSASMFVKLPAVRDAALGVLDDLVAGRDQAFLVEFSDRARLAAGPTRDLDTLRSIATGLDPGGRTSLWEAVVFSLVQLQGAAGRRALLVYSDGADEDGDVSYRTALAFARRVGVPVYAIVANDESARLGGLGSSFLPSLGGRIERLAEATGGRAWVVRKNADLAPIYAEVRAELAAQYRLGYYAPAAAEDGGWRRVTVDVGRPGARARTVAGYRK